MRPGAIVNFERLYLVSIGLVLVQQVLGYFFMRDMFNSVAGGMDMAEGTEGIFGVIMIFAIIFGVAMATGVPLIFWWLAARKRKEFAKWVLLVLTILSALNWLFTVVALFLVPEGPQDIVVAGGLQSMQAVLVMIDGVAEIIGIVALVYLFRPEADAWFRGLSSADSADVFR
jgi:hypothetical protein